MLPPAVNSLILSSMVCVHSGAAATLLYRRSGAAGLEDGTQSFLSIAAARHGFTQIDKLGGFAAIDRHMACLSMYLMAKLACMKHANGTPVVAVYCCDTTKHLLGCYGDLLSQMDSCKQHHNDMHHKAPAGYTSSDECNTTAVEGAGGGADNTYSTDPSEMVTATSSTPVSNELLTAWQAAQGPVVSFNVLRPDGSWVGYREVQKLASIHNICLRTGELTSCWFFL